MYRAMTFLFFSGQHYPKSSKPDRRIKSHWLKTCDYGEQIVCRNTDCPEGEGPERRRKKPSFLSDLPEFSGGGA